MDNRKRKIQVTPEPKTNKQQKDEVSHADKAKGNSGKTRNDVQD